MVTLSLTHNSNELLSNFSHSKALSSNHQESINRLPFVVTYNPLLLLISNIEEKVAVHRGRYNNKVYYRLSHDVIA